MLKQVGLPGAQLRRRGQGTGAHQFSNISHAVIILTAGCGQHPVVFDIKGYKLLTGIRGEAPKDIEAIKGILAKVSEIAIDNPEINEIDLNPVIVHESGASIVDSRVIMG